MSKSYNKGSLIREILADLNSNNYSKLSFDSNQFSKDNCSQLGKAINKATNLIELEFKDVQFSDIYYGYGNMQEGVGINNILDGLINRGTQIKLTLAYENQYYYMHEQNVTKIRNLIENNKFLSLSLKKVLCMDGVSFDNTLNSIANNNSLLSLELDLPNTDKEVKQQLLNKLSTHPSIKEITLGEYMLNHSDSYQSLEKLSHGNQLTSITLLCNHNNEDALKLSHVISHTSQVNKIHLRFNSLSESGKKALYSAKQYNETLNEINITVNDNTNSIDSLIAHDNQASAAYVGPDGIIAYLSQENLSSPVVNAPMVKVCIESGIEAAKALASQSLYNEMTNKVEEIIQSHPTLSSHAKQQIYYQIRDLHASNTQSEMAQLYGQKAKFWEFVNKIDSINKLHPAQNNNAAKAVENQFTIINHSTNTEIDKIWNIVSILCYNSNIITQLKGEDELIGKFFTDMGKDDLAMVYYSHNYSKKHDVTIEYPLLQEYIESLENQNPQQDKMTLLGCDHTGLEVIADS